LLIFYTEHIKFDVSFNINKLLGKRFFLFRNVSSSSIKYLWTVNVIGIDICVSNVFVLLLVQLSSSTGVLDNLMMIA